MNIEETKNIIIELIQSQSELTSLFNHNDDFLIYSTSYPPTQRVELSERPTTIVFHNEEYHCFQLITFQLLQLDGNSRQIQIKISVIVEVYLLSSRIGTTLLLTPNTDPRLNITYLIPNDDKCDLFCVELDLERITRNFPRLVERVCDAIVFLGDVLLAGGKE